MSSVQELAEYFGLGCHLDDPSKDGSDKALKPGVGAPASLVTRTRDRFTLPIWNQKRSNGCVGFAGAKAVMHATFLSRKDGYTPTYSPMFGWYNAKDPADKALNVGCQIRNFAAAVQRYGMCLWDADPFEVTPEDYLQRLGQPRPAVAYTQAARHQILDKYRIADGDVDAMLDALQRGYSLHYAFPVYQAYFDVPHATGLATWERCGDRNGGALAGWHSEWIYDADVIDGKQTLYGDGSWGVDMFKGGRVHKDVEFARRFQDIWVYTKQEIV